MKIISILILQILLSLSCYCQYKGFYPPNTKWYQDPLGFRPLELSSAPGFTFGTVASISSLLLLKEKKEIHKFFYQEWFCSLGYKPPYSNLVQNNIGFLYQVRKQMGLGLEWNLSHFESSKYLTWNFGARPFARWYVALERKQRLFFEYGAGLSYSFNRFPAAGTGWGADTARTGTRFNFTTKYGIGTEIYLNKSLLLQVGARHFHLSNGNIKGVQRNPAHDSNGLFAGLLYCLDQMKFNEKK